MRLFLEESEKVIDLRHKQQAAAVARVLLGDGS
jgi:hypothetical protein